jgi:lysyl-tRNA synthetase class 1
VLLAVSRRDEIEAVLAQYRTKKVAPAEDASEQEAADLADSVANEDDEEGDPGAGASADAIARFPYRPYCRQCGRDTVTTTAYDDATTTLSYTCSSCGFEGTTNISTDTDGKLVWKVDWPMRWAYESVNFEPAGRDHMTPGSSYTVGTELVSSIFDWRAPARVIYAFVGFAGVQKMSSSAGGVPTAADALRILESPMLRWLYVRRAPTQAFDIDFGPSVVRLYDEWDALGRKAAEKADVATLAWHRASETAAAGRLPTSPVPVPFRTLSSVADVTAGSAELISRIIESAGFPHDSVDDLEPRLSKAMQWTAEHVPADERTNVRSEPDTERLSSLTEDEELWLRIFLDRLPAEPDLDSVTAVVYGTPKVARGLGFDDAPTDQVKADQKDFFRLLYNLLVSADRGPRLPTLVLALGTEKVRRLLGA